VRYTGSALAFTGASLFAGGPAPVVATWLVKLGNGSPWGLVALVAVLNIVSFIMIAIGPETAGNDMNRIDTNLGGAQAYPDAVKRAPV